MKLTEMTINEFNELLASNAPAPGGGSVSALAGSIGIALTAMVANLTVGREKYKEHEELMQEMLKETNKLKENLLEAINRDTETYNKVGEVFKMPKTTDEEKLIRSKAIQEAYKASTIVPFEIMEFSLKSLELTKKAVGNSNPNAASDLGVAALNLKASVQGAWLNVLINIGCIKDESFVSEYRKKGEDVLEKAISISDEIYEAIKSKL